MEICHMIRLLPVFALTACFQSPTPKPPALVSEVRDSTQAAATRIWKGLPPADKSTRLEAASRALLGRPYLLGGLGEGDSSLGEPKPRLRLDAFDCVTYLETSLMLAVSVDSSRFLSNMDSIRYLHGRVDWKSRNHFFEGEWLPRNKHLAKLVSFSDDTVEMRSLNRKSFYAKRNVDVSDTTLALRMTPRERAIARWSKPSDTTRISGVGFIGKVTGYPVLHTGFLVERKGQIAILRHASQAGTVREQPIADYLREKPKFVGVVVWEWFP
jgi:hypothetical protein